MKMNEFYEVDGCTDFIPVKLIEEHKHMTNTLEVELTETGYRTVVPHIYSFPKVNEHQKPVVPKFVAEWIEELKTFLSTYHGDIDLEVNDFLSKNSVKFIDIKYNSTITTDGYNNVIQQYSALVVYEEV